MLIQNTPTRQIRGCAEVYAYGTSTIYGAASFSGVANTSIDVAFVTLGNISSLGAGASKCQVNTTNVVPKGSLIVGENVRAARVIADQLTVRIVPVGTVGKIIAMTPKTQCVPGQPYAAASITVDFGADYGGLWKIPKSAWAAIQLDF